MYLLLMSQGISYIEQAQALGKEAIGDWFHFRGINITIGSQGDN